MSVLQVPFPEHPYHVQRILLPSCFLGPSLTNLYHGLAVDERKCFDKLQNVSLLKQQDQLFHKRLTQVENFEGSNRPIFALKIVFAVKADLLSNDHGATLHHLPDLFHDV